MGLLAGCSMQQKPVAMEPASEEAISVAIYPHIPNVDLFEDILVQEWEKLEPNVPLIIERWDCYSGPSECDVLMYDAIVLSYLVENDYIQPIVASDIEDLEGIIPFAKEGTAHNGNYYGVPYLLCGDILIYYKEDAELEKVETIAELHAVVEERQKDDTNTGVVVYTEIGNPYHYLDAALDLSGEYSMFEEMPDCSNLDEQVLQQLQIFNALAMELPEDKLEKKNNKELFCEGYGFAYYGVSEHMSYMEPILDRVAVKNLSLADNENIPLYYVDITSVAAHVTDPEKLALCKKMMNMVASEEFLEELCFANGKVQYLLPARESVYLTAAKDYPMYDQLRGMVMDMRNKVFRFGVDFYEYQELYSGDVS